MKHRDVNLDFTPLLDVTLILLFFFLLFSTFELEQTRSTAAEQMAAAREQLAQAELLRGELEEALAIAENAGGRQLPNTEALMEFNRSANIKLILSMDEAAVVRIFRGNTLIATASPDDDLAQIVCSSLEQAGYSREDTVLCEFILDGSQPGTASAYRKIRQNLLFVKGTYQYFYYSETDLSLGVE